jgi:hypothetical protein
MALTEAEKAELVDNQFVFDGSAGGAEYVRHLPCDTGIYLGEPQDVPLMQSREVEFWRESAIRFTHVRCGRGR